MDGHVTYKGYSFEVILLALMISHLILVLLCDYPIYLQKLFFNPNIYIYIYNLSDRIYSLTFMA